ncbi:hypothetical protein [Lactobacillus gasseri]|uniref:hypothetical protein n=1 Tax=Lactobacillus gasseri TaxID=1596 RepID=UPI001183FBB3|nr:hypothetical protein [Lactobacillus gasseri]
MTEETINENVTATQPTTTEKAKEITMKTYYWSNDAVPFRVIRTNDTITEDQYPIVITAPDPSIKAPKYDWIEHKWIETSEESLGQRLTSVVEKLEDAQKSISVLQEAHQDTLKNNETTDTVMEQLQTTVQMSTRMMATLSTTVSALIKAYQTKNTTGTNQGGAQ